jgi:anti-sigma28 factor (negative regulator of flagellin synthesis)
MRIDRLGMTGPDPENPTRKREENGKPEKAADRARFSLNALALYQTAREARLSVIRERIASGAYDAPNVREQVARMILNELGG